MAKTKLKSITGYFNKYYKNDFDKMWREKGLASESELIRQILIAKIDEWRLKRQEKKKRAKTL